MPRRSARVALEDERKRGGAQDPVPSDAPIRPWLFHDTFETGMFEPLGGVNAAASARTLTRRALPRLRFAFEKPIVVTLGVPLVLRLTWVTGRFGAQQNEPVQ